MQFSATFFLKHLVGVIKSYTFASAFENETLLKYKEKSSLIDLRYKQKSSSTRSERLPERSGSHLGKTKLPSIIIETGTLDLN